MRGTEGVDQARAGRRVGARLAEGVVMGAFGFARPAKHPHKFLTDFRPERCYASLWFVPETQEINDPFRVGSTGATNR